MNISVTSANEVNDTIKCSDNLDQSIELSDNVLSSPEKGNYSNSFDNILSSPEDEIPEYPDLIDTDYNYVYPSTVGIYFEDGVLDSEYKDSTLIFSGDFEDFGKLEIPCNNVTIVGVNSNLKNTVFMLTGNDITLKDLNFNQDSSIRNNQGATIFVAGDDISLVNLTINYIVPRDVEAYAIYADGYNFGPLKNLLIMNSSIYFEGHNDNVKKYNCALKLVDAQNSIIENNTITTSLPLKNIDFEGLAATLNSAYVYSLGIEGCHDSIINNNVLVSDVNKRTTDEYPTLDGIMISKSNDVTLSNNSIYMTDFVTYPGIENYLYGIDVHNLKNLWIVNNSVSMVTTGGKLAMGTAYPIQISGPADRVIVEYNDLYSFSNGPNIGVYSQCSNGATYVMIRYNKINVTGLAGTDDWALVTGIESQDNFAQIFNNEIEVHSVADVGKDDNLYAISYRQSIVGPNTFDIENNVAVTDGYYAVYILNSEYSSVINNTLISFNDNVRNGDDSYSQGPRNHYNEEYYNNNVIRANDYYSNRNAVDNGNIIEIAESSSSNSIDIGAGSGNVEQEGFSNNPAVPRFNDLSGIKQDDAQDYSGFIDDGSTQATIKDVDGTAQRGGSSQQNQNANNQNALNQNAEIYNGNNGEIEASGNVNASNIDGNNLNVMSNSSSSSVGVSSNPVSGKQGSASASSSQSVSKKAYAIEEKVKEDNFIPSVFLVILVMILLIIGYKRKSEEI